MSRGLALVMCPALVGDPSPRDVVSTLIIALLHVDNMHQAVLSKVRHSRADGWCCLARWPALWSALEAFHDPLGRKLRNKERLASPV